MKKNFMMIALASVLMMPVSCTKNELEAPQGPAAGELTFVAYAEGGDSKTTLNDEDGSVAWAVGDQIKFDYELEKVAGEAVLSSVLAEGDIVEGAATFTAALPEAFTMSTKEYDGESRHMYVTYPASIETDYSSASEFLVTVPAEQDGTFANASIALAKWDPENPTAPLQFYNLCGLLQIEIADDAARQIVLEASSDLVGNVSVTFTQEGYEGLPFVKAVKEGTKTITVDVKGAGVYYVAVLPGSIENLYVAINDAEGNLLGDRTANNAIPVARKQIRKLGTIGTGFADRYYVKTTVAGSGDGSSWDNAADLTGLKALVATNAVKKVYVAAGTYKFDGKNFISNSDAAANFSIYGGYPADAAGQSLSGRDVETNQTIFDGGYEEGVTTTDRRIWVIQQGTFTFSGLTFQNAFRAYPSNDADIGSAVMLEGPVNVTFTDCTFQNNTNLQAPKDGTLGGGALRLASSSVSVFNNCEFLNNITDYDGGAVYINATASATFNNCEFSGNTATHDGGAVYQVATATATFNACEFYSNSARYGSAVSTVGATTFNECIVGATEKANVATRGAICINKGAAGAVVCQDCAFKYNTAAIGGAIYIDAIDNESSLSVSNTQFYLNAATSTTNNNQGGGAIGISGDSKNYTGILNFMSCDFDTNTAVGAGGAIWANGCSVAFTDCAFTTNSVTGIDSKETPAGGGAIWSATSVDAKLFFNRCFFANNKTCSGSVNETNYKWGHHICVTSTKALLGLNNCVIRAPWGLTMGGSSGKGTGSLVTTRAYTAIVNTTMYSQTGNPMVTEGGPEQGGCSFINDIIVNAAGTPNCFYNVATTRYQHVAYTLYTQAKEGILNFAEVSSLNGVTYGDFGWEKKGNGVEVPVNDVRGHIYAYNWNGTLLNDKAYTKASYEQVVAALTNTTQVGPAFLEWLGNGAELKKDIRGVARNTSAMWPGSYEDATATAGLESLNVK